MARSTPALHPMTEDFLRELEVRGYRTTTPRRLMVDAISRRAGPFTAEELCDDVPAMGRATVYRNIKLLQEMGFLCRVLMEDGSPRYQPSHQRHHHHLVCVECGAVRDLTDCDLTGVLGPAIRRSGFEIVGHRLDVYGRCLECQQGVSRPVHPSHQ